ncbi:MAG: xanthine phosphoribosyltransferase [Ruminococcaceae bacterium]|nr:xanthine phosphoribosyltransferase [Oscillospiraceae bacterium]
MKLLEDRIRRDGKVAPGNVLRVDSFINHQMDILFMEKLAEEIRRRFTDKPVDKILTIEASGIAIATLVAQKFGVPLVSAKKSKSSNLPDNIYTCSVKSYTHGNVNSVLVTQDYLKAGENVLIIDDFLAHGEALKGLINLVEQAGGTVVGAGIVVEKAYQRGADALRASGLQVESLARVASMDAETGTVEFIPDGT